MSTGDRRTVVIRGSSWLTGAKLIGYADHEFGEDRDANRGGLVGVAADRGVDRGTSHPADHHHRGVVSCD